MQLKSLRVGYLESEGSIDERRELQALSELGVKLVPIQLPSDLPVWEMTLVLNTEAATVFDHYTKQGETEGLNPASEVAMRNNIGDPNTYSSFESWFGQFKDFIAKKDKKLQTLNLLSDVLDQFNISGEGNFLSFTTNGPIVSSIFTGLSELVGLST